MLLLFDQGNYSLFMKSKYELECEDGSLVSKAIISFYLDQIFHDEVPFKDKL